MSEDRPKTFRDGQIERGECTGPTYGNDMDAYPCDEPDCPVCPERRRLAMQNNGHKLIGIEGIDAAGKATQARLLAEAIGATTFSFPAYESVTGTLLSGHLSESWAAAFDMPAFIENTRLLNAQVRQCLMTTDRYARQPGIRQALEQGHVVLDRWWGSSLAYGQEEGLAREWILEISRELLVPDLWVLLDVPASVGLERRAPRDANERDVGKLDRVREMYLREFATCDERHSGRAVVIDGQMPQEDVHVAILKYVERLSSMTREQKLTQIDRVVTKCIAEWPGATKPRQGGGLTYAEGLRAFYIKNMESNPLWKPPRCWAGPYTASKPESARVFGINPALEDS